MTLYIIVALFPLVIGYLYNISSGQNASLGLATENGQVNNHQLKVRWRWLALAAFPMFLVIAIRGYHMGADTSVYLKFFDYVKNVSLDQALWINQTGADFEVGYVVFEKVVSLFTKNHNVYQVIYTAVYFVFVVTFANQLEKENFLFLYFFATLGLYTFMFTGVRQCLAMCVCIFSYRFIKNRKLIPFIICMVIAFFFHKSAILFCVTYFMYKRKLSLFNIVFYGVFSVFSYLNIDVIQEWFNEYFEYEYEIESTGNGFVYLAVVTLITIFSIVVFKIYKETTPENQGITNISIIAMIFWVLRIVTRVAERPSYYFLFFTMAMLSVAIPSIKKTDFRQIARYGIIVLAMLLYIYRFRANFSFLVPYDTFF